MEMKTVNPKIKSVFSISSANTGLIGSAHGGPNAAGLEIRPGGMLVQMRDSNSNSNPVSVPTIKVRVKYGSSYHEIRISSHSSFGELKKMLAERTGLHQEDQKLIFKKKERDSRTYLDVARVKDGSKISLVEDILSKEKRCLQMLKTANAEKASKSLAEISLEVDKLSGQVTSLEERCSRGEKITEKEVDDLTELLMTKLVQLDGITAEGDSKLQRRVQVKKVQKNVETLDKLKLHFTTLSRNADKVLHKQKENPNGFLFLSKEKKTQPVQPGKKTVLTGQLTVVKQPLSHSESFVVTTKWETFD